MGGAPSCKAEEGGDAVGAPPAAGPGELSTDENAADVRAGRHDAAETRTTDPRLGPMADQDTSAGLGYEQARDELIDVVRRLEAGGATLEESLALWERGEELAKVCRRWLEGARARLDAALAAEETDGGGADGADGAEGAAGE
jgi:exodeoxyribonuclease VII small subunit